MTTGKSWQFSGLIGAALLLAGCASTPPLEKPVVELNETTTECRLLWMSSEINPPEAALSTVTKLFRQNCSREVISLGAILRDRYRDKIYNLTSEGWKFVGTASSTDYVLEGYERTYLTMLMARSYAKLGNEEGAAIELRRANEEQKARIYNQSDDPINMMMQAALWENLNEPSHARSSWKRAQESARASELVKSFTEAQIERLDRGGKTSRRIWSIENRGMSPSLDFKFTSPSFTKSYYEIVPMSEYPDDCASGRELMQISTRPWFEELAERNLANKRTLEYAQGLARGVLGLTWSVIGVTTGFAIGLVGCLDRNSTQETCESAIQLGVLIGGLGLQFTEDHIKPDLRRWDDIPSEIALVSDKSDRSICRFQSDVKE